MYQAPGLKCKQYRLTLDPARGYAFPKRRMRCRRSWKLGTMGLRGWRKRLGRKGLETFQIPAIFLGIPLDILYLWVYTYR